MAESPRAGPAQGAGAAPAPTEIRLHQKSRLMEIVFADGRTFRLPYEFLRVHSPSAEVRGHGPGQEVLQVGKREVEIRSLEPYPVEVEVDGDCVLETPIRCRVGTQTVNILVPKPVDWLEPPVQGGVAALTG